MRSLRENKGFVFAAVLLLVSMIYLDHYLLSGVEYIQRTLFSSSYMYEKIAHLLDVASHGTTLLVLSLLLYISGIFLSGKIRDTGRDLIIGYMVSGIVVQVLKHVFGRARPRITHEFWFIGPSFRDGYDAFPSGHTTVFFSLAYVLSRHFPKYQVVIYLVAAGASAKRVLCLSHFPSDVIAGAMLGTFVGMMLASMKCLRFKTS